METKTKYQKGKLSNGEKKLWEAVKNLPDSKAVKLNVEWKTHGLFNDKSHVSAATKKSR